MNTYICMYIYEYLQISIFLPVDIHKDLQCDMDNKEKAEGVSPIRPNRTKEPANCSQIRKFHFQVSFRQMRQVMQNSPCSQLQEASRCLWENGAVQMGLCVLPHPYTSGTDGQWMQYLRCPEWSQNSQVSQSGNTNLF